MAEDWYALVVGNYETVMALPVKRKFGMRMTGMPAFTQRFDISGPYNLATKQRIAQAVLKFSKLIQINTSEEKIFEGFSKRKRTNFFLDLSDSYEDIFNNYSEVCKKNLRQAAKRGCTLRDEVSIDEMLCLYQNAYGTLSSYTEKHYSKFRSLVQFAKEKNFCHFSSVVDEVGDTVYAGVLLDDGRRLYYMMGAPTEKGRHMRSTYFFMDAMIRRFAGSRAIFDFEGSDIPTVAKFYQSFSPQTEHYWEFYINQYPFPFNKMIDHKLKTF
mgnify:CR=1 FL=1